MAEDHVGGECHAQERDSNSEPVAALPVRPAEEAEPSITSRNGETGDHAQEPRHLPHCVEGFLPFAQWVALRFHPFLLCPPALLDRWGPVPQGNSGRRLLPVNQM